jgi:uncharacterized protein DUF5658
MSARIQERRATNDRRRSVLHALWRGNFARRRHAPRRHSERHIVVTDWFHAQWLAVGIGILLLCATDAILTLTLISHGAVEINPLMAPLVKGSGHSFGYWKIGMTAIGVLVLTLLARVRFWGRTVGTILYLVFGAYAVLVGYELFLLRNIPLD